MTRELANQSTVLLMTLGISLLFLTMIEHFLMVLLLAGIFSALARPLYLRLLRWSGGRRHPASLLSLLTIICLLLIPLIVLTGIVFAQALNVSQSVAPWVRQLNEPGAFAAAVSHLPFHDELAPYHDFIVTKGGELVTAVSRYLIRGLSTMTLGTANFMFMVFVMLYAIYFLQMDGDKLVARIFSYLPLNERDARLMLNKFASVSRAMLKGTLLIGIIQGTLGGLAFAAVGIGNAAFWGTMMAVLSVIPGVGPALVWIPAVAILLFQGHVVATISLGLFCGLIVSSLDSVLRPILVGKDTQMHELMIFLGTLGGIFMFGIPGILIGPLIASLFVTIWEVYGTTFRHVLPAGQAAPPPLPPLPQVPQVPQVPQSGARPPAEASAPSVEEAG